LELERLDALQSAIWPMTQNRKVTSDDGKEVQIEPEIKAIQQVLSIMDRRTKLLGMDNVNINVQMDVQEKQGNIIKATLANQQGMAAGANQFSPEEDARKLLALMAASGVLPEGIINQLMSGSEEIQDAELVESDETIEIYPGSNG
jgi:hypothetical protein